jgi:hypothetical protein
MAPPLNLENWSMKSTAASFRLPSSTLLLLLASATCLPQLAVAQDNAFLACDRFADRGQRIACLEDALEAATNAEPTSAAPAAATAATPAPAQPSVAEPVAPAATPAPAATAVAPTPAIVEAEEEDGPSLLDRLREFGRDDSATISADPEGEDQLHDTITALETRRDLWIVTLSSGQVWMQDYPRTMNLREGDRVTIYRAGFGNGYRLSAERLSGFIRVKRVR